MRPVKKENRLGLPRLIVAVSIPAFVMAISSCSAVLGFSDAGQKYLDAMHNPCQHPEIFSDVSASPEN